MSSADYWREREAEALGRYVKDEEAYAAELKRIYQDMLDACQREIDRFYGKYAADEHISIAEAKRRISKADIAEFERKAAKYVRERNFSDQANAEMRLYNAMMKINRLEMLKANIGLELISGHDEMEKFMAGILKNRTEEELQRQAGILGRTVRDNARQADRIVNASFHNAKFSDRIWMYQDALRADLGKLLQSGMIQGKNPRQLARELQRTFGASRYNAERLMRTELARVQTDAQRESFKRNGFTMYEFIANSGCCDVCSAMDGKHFKVDKMQPGLNAPPVHPGCRCSIAAWEDDEEYDAWLDYLSKGGTTAEWKKRIKIGLPGSARSYRRSLREISEGKAGLDKRRSNMLERIKATGEYQRYAREEITTRDLAYLSAATGHEFALFRSKREDILVRGNSMTCDITGELGDEILSRRYEWVAHSHVDGGPLSASIADRKTLARLGQESSIIVGVDGEERTFTQSVFDD